jgi:transcriptional regulator with XRE-family HTH domain
LAKRTKETMGVGAVAPVVKDGDPVFAGNLRALLDARGMPARDLAARIGISPQAVSQWFVGQTVPTPRRLVQIADALGVAVDRLTIGPNAPHVLPIRQLHMNLARDSKGHPILDEGCAEHGLWQVPAEVVAFQGVPPDVAALMVKDNALAPDLRLGDWVLGDVACRSIIVPGIYLILIAGSPAWRRCHPLLPDKLQVSDCATKQEVATKDVSVLARALRLLTQP